MSSLRCIHLGQLYFHRRHWKSWNDDSRCYEISSSYLFSACTESTERWQVFLINLFETPNNEKKLAEKFHSSIQFNAFFYTAFAAATLTSRHACFTRCSNCKRDTCHLCLISSLNFKQPKNTIISKSPYSLTECTVTCCEHCPTIKWTWYSSFARITQKFFSRRSTDYRYALVERPQIVSLLRNWLDLCKSAVCQGSEPW